jgi:hypothetical protein
MTTQNGDPDQPAASVAANETMPGSMFLFALCLYWLTNSGFDTSEGLFHYQIASHIVETGELGFDQPMPGIFTVAPNGRTYGSHEFGNSLLLIPTAALNHVLGHVLTRLALAPEKIARLQQFVLSFQANVYSALTLLFLYLMLVEEFGLTGRQAFAGCVVLGTCTFYWTYSRNLFDGVLCSLLLTAALRYLLRFQREGKTMDALAAFGILGFAVDTRLSMALPVVVSLGFVTLFCTGRRLRALISAGIALAPFAAWQLWYNQLRTGNPLVSPVQTLQYAENNALDGDLANGLLGLLFSPGKSVFVYAPVLLLSLAAIPKLWRKHRPAAAFIVALAVIWLLLHAKLRSWYGAWGWGPRHFVTLLPILAIPALVFIPSVWSRRSGKAILIPLAAGGFILALASLISNWHYRMELRNRSDPAGLESFEWSFSQNQAADMLIGSLDNIKVVLGIGEPSNVPAASDLNNYASNRINMWWYILPNAGVPRTAVAAAVCALLLGLVVAARRVGRWRGT